MTAEERKGIAAVTAQTVMAVVTFFVAKDALHEIPPDPLILLRSGLAGLLLLFLALAAPGRPEVRPRPHDVWRLAGLGLLAVPLNQGFFFHGLVRTTAAHASLLYALTPALVLLIGVVRGNERLTAPRAGGIALAFAGVVLVLLGRPVQSASSALAVRQLPADGTVAGDLLVLGAVASWALYTAMSRGVVERLGTVRATAGSLGLGALAFVPLGLPGMRGIDFAALPARTWLSLAWLVVVASTLSYLAWYYAIRRLDPSRVAIFNNLQPLGSALLAWALGARPGAALFAGGALVVSGVLLAQRRTARAPAGATA